MDHHVLLFNLEWLVLHLNRSHFFFCYYGWWSFPKQQVIIWLLSPCHINIDLTDVWRDFLVLAVAEALWPHSKSIFHHFLFDNHHVILKLVLLKQFGSTLRSFLNHLGYCGLKASILVKKKRLTGPVVVLIIGWHCNVPTFKHFVGHLSWWILNVACLVTIEVKKALYTLITLWILTKFVKNG